MGVDAVIVPRPLAVEALTVTGCEVRVTNTGPSEDEYSFTITVTSVTNKSVTVARASSTWRRSPTWWPL